MTILLAILFQDNMRRSEEKGYARSLVRFLKPVFDGTLLFQSFILCLTPPSSADCQPLQDRVWLFLVISLRSMSPFSLWPWLSWQSTGSELQMRALHLHPVRVCCSCLRDPSNVDRDRQVGGWSPHSEKRRWTAEIRNAESIVPARCPARKDGQG